MPLWMVEPRSGSRTCSGSGESMDARKSCDDLPYLTRFQIMARLRPGERILDIGCGSGDLARLIKEKGCRVVGIELTAERAEMARASCERILIGNVETMPLPLEPAGFDVLLFSNILEHLLDPVATIRRLLPFLSPKGRVLVDLPNVAHWQIRLRLLRGRWDYEDSGILDRTHLRFYTRKTAREMLEQAGVEILEEDLIPDVPLLRYKRRSAVLNYKVARLRPNLLSTEMLFVVRPRERFASR